MITMTLKIAHVAGQGDGVAHTPAGPVFAPLTLPGETVRGEVVDAVGHVRIVAHGGGDGAVGLVAQELDVLGVMARVGDPDAACLDPILGRLLHCGGDADMIEFERGHGHSPSFACAQ